MPNPNLPDTPDPAADPADAPSLLSEIATAIDADDLFAEVDEEDEIAAAPAKDADGVDDPLGDVPAKDATPAGDKPADAKPDPKGGDAPKADDKPKPDVAVEDEIKSLGIKNEKTAERFRGMSSELKTVSAERDALKDAGERLTQWQDTIKSTGASPEDLGSALEILHHANAGTPDAAKTALAMIDEFRTKLAQRHGLEIAGVDPLEGFADLIQQVADGDVTKTAAAEIARLRRQTADSTARTQQRTEQQRMDDKVRDGAAAVDTLCAQLKASDPMYAEKFALLKDMIPDIGQSLPPEKWAGAFKRLYDNVKLPAAVDSRRVDPKTPEPMRREAGGGGEKKPGSMLDAVSQALGL